MKAKVVRLLNATETIKQAKIGRTTLWRLVKAGKVKPIMFGSTKTYNLDEVIKVFNKK
mgnify:CR=1 FL=1